MINRKFSLVLKISVTKLVMFISWVLFFAALKNFFFEFFKVQMIESAIDAEFCALKKNNSRLEGKFS